jgi:O-antigen ligase
VVATPTLEAVPGVPTAWLSGPPFSINAIWAGAALTVPVALMMLNEGDMRYQLLAVASAVGYLLAFPDVTMRLFLLSVSCDRLLTMKVGSATLRAAHGLALLLLLRLVFTRLWRREPLNVPLRPIQPLVMYLLVALVSSVFSANLSKSLGYLCWAVFDLVAVFAVVIDVARRPGGLDWLLRWWMLGALVSAGFGLLQLALGLAHLPVPLADQHLGEYPRINGFNYEPAYFALYLESVGVVLLVQVLAAHERGWRQIGKITAVMMLIGAAALSMSRSGWLGMLLLLLWVVAQSFGRPRLQRRLFQAVLVAGIVFTGSSLLLPERFVSFAPKMAEMALNPKETSSSAPRLGMLGQAIQVFKRNPFLGVGLGGYGGYVLENPELLEASQKRDPDHLVTTNLWLETAAEEGVFGLFALGWFIWATLAALARARKIATDPRFATLAEAMWFSIALVFIVLYQFNQTLWRLDVWTLLGLAWAVVLQVRNDQPTATLRSAA